MIKLILIILILLVSVAIGLTIKNFFSTKYNIYVDFKDIIQSIKSEISFLKTDKRTLLKKQCCKNKHAQEFLNDYIKLGQAETMFLTSNENLRLNEFLDSIGKSDVDGELMSLKYYENLINKDCQVQEEKLNKYGNFSVKLAIIIGTLISIILI